MVNVEKFMSDYLAMKQDVANAQDNAENAVLSMLASTGKSLTDKGIQDIIGILVAEDVGNKQEQIKFYEQYIVNDNNVVNEVE